MNKRDLILGVLIVALVVAIGVCVYSFRHPRIVYKDTPITTTTTTNKDKPTVSSKGTLSVTKGTVPKFTVSETMSAQVGNKKVTVPLTQVSKELSKDSDNDNNSVVEFHNDIDVSKFVEPLVPKWEMGVGIGRHSNNTYIPISIQRNYKTDKAVRVSVHLDTEKSLRPNGVEVVHVWKF